MTEIILKKRGRKPKNKDISNNDTVQLVKKKRGRKPTGKIIDIHKEFDSNFPDCIIAHLPLSSKDISQITGEVKSNESNIVKSDFVINLDNNEHKHNMVDKCINCTKFEQQYNELKNAINKEHYIEKNLEKRKHICNYKLVSIIDGEQKWNNKTDIWCWWCCNPFDNIPVGLPEKFDNKTFYLHGSFCSLNCAHAYNLNINDCKIWERYSLLKFLKFTIFNDDNDIIIASPPREALNVFGGHLSINDFRNKSIILTKEFRYLLPPLIAITGIIDEVPKDKSLSINNQLKLKRSKPILSFNTNLLQMMKK